MCYFSYLFHIKDGKETRATVLGVESRGVVCAGFNSPGIYGSVVKAYDWIKEVLTKESKEGELCPDAADAANTDYAMNPKKSEAK